MARTKKQTHQPVEIIHHSLYTPVNCLTWARWLREGYRVKGDPVASLLVLHDFPHARRRTSEEPYPAEVVQALRERLEDQNQPTDNDWYLIQQLDATNQVSWAHLYPEEAVVPISTPTQAEAWELLSGLWRHGSHRDQFIFGGQHEDGTKWCYTAGGVVRKDWDIIDHKKGDCYLGSKRGESTRIIDIDLDRHTGGVCSSRHRKMVLDTLRFLQESMPWAAPHVTNINPANGSCHITMYLPRAISLEKARAVIADIRSECPWLEGVEIYPDSCPQFLLPLRRDKVTIIDRVLTPSIKAWRGVDVPGLKQRKGHRPRKLRKPYLAMDAASYWCWINDENRKPCDLDLVEAELIKACQGLPDSAVPGKVAKARKRSGTPQVRQTEGGIGKLKNRCASVLVDFLSGGDPKDDYRKHITVTLRTLCHVEGMTMEPAIDWTTGMLDRHPHFVGKPVAERPRLVRMIEETAKAVWRDNGFQADPTTSPYFSRRNCAGLPSVA